MKTRKLLALLLSMIMVIGLMTTAAMAADKTGTVTPAYTRADAFWGEGTSNSTDSFVVELYEGTTKIASSKLNNLNGIIDGDVYVTWSIPFDGVDSDYWDVEWAEGYPKYDMAPDTVKLIADGTEVATNEVQYNAPDNLNKIVAIAEGYTGGVVAYTSLTDAMGKFNGRQVNVLRDVTESIEGFYGCTLTTNVEGGVTITNTYENWIYATDLNVGSDVTVVGGSVFFDGGESTIEGTVHITDTHYHSSDAKVTIQNGGNMIVDGAAHIRYNESADTGLYIYGDNDNSTVELDIAYYLGAYSGTVYAEDANIEVGYMLLNGDTDGEGYAPVAMTLDNSTFATTGTGDGQKQFNTNGTDTVITLADGSAVKVLGDYNAAEGVTLDVDSTSSIEDQNGNVFEAEIDGAYYTTLQAAIDAVGDDETVKLLNDVTVSDGANAFGITRGVSFTLDLNGKTLTANTTNAAIRVNINNDDVTESVTVNIKNGTVTAASAAYCALIAAGKSEDVTLTVNLDDVALNGSNPNGSVIKVFPNAIVNVNDGTVITGTDSYGGMEVMGVANIYDGAEVYQKGTTSYNGNLVGVSSNGVANVYGGKGESAKIGLIVMTSGGTLNVYGGIWTAADEVITSQNDKNSYPNGGNSIINVYDGTFTGAISEWGYGTGSIANTTISGGTYTVDPTNYLADGYGAVPYGGTYGVTVAPQVTMVAQINGGTKYQTIEAAFVAAKTGDTVTIFAGEYTGDMTVNKDITVVGETDASGNNLVTINGKLNITADGATVKNLNVNNGSNTAGYISAKDVTVEGCSVVGGNGFRYCYTSGTVTFKDSTITGSVYGIHFDGSASGAIVIDNCVITGWTSFASTITKVTMTDTVFENGNYNYIRFYQDAEIKDCTFNEEMTIDVSDSVEADITISNCNVDTVDGEASEKSILNLIDADDVVTSNITVNGELLGVVAEIGDTSYKTLAAAIAAAEDGDTITLLADVSLTESLVLNTEGTITIDGNGYKITQADGYTDTQNGLIMLGATTYGNAETATHNYTIKDVVFDGTAEWSVVRAQGVTLTMDSCTLQNCTQTKGFSLIRTDYTEATIKNTIIQNNNGLMGIAFNWNCGDLLSKLIVDECVIENNTFNDTAAIYYVKGGGCEIKNSEFVNNDVNCNTNGAVIYLGFQEDCSVTGCLFQDNEVKDSSTSTRVAGAIFFGCDADISGNAFVNNTAANANGSTGIGQDICTSVYYGDVDLSGNYFDGSKPVEGVDYLVQHTTSEVETRGTCTLSDYYKSYSLDENGNVVLSVKVDPNAPVYSGGSSSSSSGSYAVITEKAENGTIKVSPSRADAGDTVTITVTPDKGYELDSLTVTDKNGYKVKVTEKNGKYTFEMPKGKVTVEATFVESDDSLPFTDVTEDGCWAYDEIEWAYEEGLMNGNTATTFNPNGLVTRQQVWMILARMSGYAPEDMAAAKGWAVSTGVSDGSNPGNAVTRQQLVTLIWRAEGEPEGDVSVLANYPDAGSVSEYAKEAMAWAVENGVIGGTAQGTLNPAGNANRAQLATILYRYVG